MKKKNSEIAQTLKMCVKKIYNQVFTVKLSENINFIKWLS